MRSVRPDTITLARVLIGRVDDGDAFHIGDTTTITPPVSGTLWLAVNDFELTYHDNHGAFTVLFR